MDPSAIETALTNAFRECLTQGYGLSDVQQELLLTVVLKTLFPNPDSETNPLEELTTQQQQALLDFIALAEQEDRSWKASILNDWLNNQSPLKRDFTHLKQTFDAILTLMPRSYFSSDYELQARLHNIIVRGYPAWGKIPENKDELYLALQDMGIKSPQIVGKYYKDPEFKELKEIFEKHRGQGLGYFSAPNAEMNIGLNSFNSPEILEMYWRDCLPALYADLLVKYGDKNGLKKMGYGERDIMGMPTQDDSPHP